MTFIITGYKGFRIQFENNWAASVQFGSGNYCTNRDSDWESPSKTDLWHSSSAETALINPAGEFVEYDGEEVQSYRTPAQVAALIAFAAAK